MDKNHPAYEQFQKWVRDNGLDREGIDLSVFWSCWIAATRSDKSAETVVKLEAELAKYWESICGQCGAMMVSTVTHPVLYCPKCGEGW